MPVNDFEPINDAGQISAREFERLGEAVKAQAKVVGSQGLVISQNSGGFQVATQDPLVFWAKITGHAAGTPTPHAWTQQRQNSGGTLSNDGEGLSGTTTSFPAYSTDGGIIPTNTIVRLYLSVAGDYYLVYPSPSGATGSMLEIKEADGSPDVLNVTTLIVDQATGLGIESGATPTVTLQVLAASLSQQGAVSLSAQVMGSGDKTFSNEIILNNGYQLQWTGSAHSPKIGADSVSEYGPLGLYLLIDGNAAFVSTSSGGAFGWQLRSNTDTASYSIVDLNGVHSGVTVSSPSAVTCYGGIVTGSGTLGVAAGGTGGTTLATNGIVYGNGTGALQALAVNASATNKFLTQSSSAAPAWATIVTADVPSAALTKTDDTNVTLTLGGTPASALLAAASLTLGWTGTLAVARGGTGAATLTANGVVYGNGTSAAGITAAGTSAQVLGGGTPPAFAAFTAFFPVSDATVLLKGSGDATKLLRLEIDGFTTGTTRVLTPPNADATIAGLEVVQTFTVVQTFAAACVANFGSGTTANTRFGSGSGNDTATGDLNAVYGVGTGAALTSAQGCTLAGYHAGLAITTGSLNTCVGANAGLVMTTAASCTLVGVNAGKAITTGSSNSTCVGTAAGQAITTGTSNSVGGLNAGLAITTGGSNCCWGSGAGQTITTQSSNTCIGTAADVSSTSVTQGVALGQSAVCQSSEFALGPNVNFMTLYGLSSTSATVQRFDVTASNIDNTHATRKYRAVLNVWDTAAREAIRLDATGSAAQVGIGGAVNGSYLLTTNGVQCELIGASTAFMTEVGLANVQTSSAGIGNAADTTDDTLFTYSLPTNSMSANGKSLRAVASGHFATNGNNKRVKMFFAGTAVADSAVLTSSNKDWVCTIEVTRIDSTHVSCVGTFIVNGTAPVVTVTANLAVSDLTANASVVKTTGASSTTGAASDVLGYMMRTEFMN